MHVMHESGAEEAQATGKGTGKVGGNPAGPDNDPSDERLEHFGATLAHELRNPAAALRHGVHILKQLAKRVASQAPEHSREMLKTLAMMERQCLQLGGMLEDFMDLGRVTTRSALPTTERVDLNQVISDSIEAAIAGLEDEKHSIVVESQGGELHVRGDRRLLTQAFTNLVNNAIKFSEADGRVRVRLHRRDGMAIVDIIDEGIGIAAEDLPRIFDLFTRTEPGRRKARDGLGIGLSIVRGVVHLHGGRVSATSEGLGHGSTFTVHLPLEH